MHLESEHTAGSGHIDREQVLAAGVKPKICIVGAGVAGLRAAHLLIQHGAEVTLLEARSRVGGRVAQNDRLGHCVDLGANWLSSGVGDPIVRLAHETETPVHSFSEAQVMLDSEGDALLESDVAELQDTFWEIVGDAIRFSNDKSATIRPSESLMDFIRSETPKRFTERSSNQADRMRRLLLQTADMWGAFVGNPAERQSLKFCWLEKCVEDEEGFVAGTFADILKKIAAPVIEKVDLRYQKIVKQVSSRDDGSVEVLVEGLSPEIFDEVIVTVPLGCLKLDQPGFVPPLPPHLQQAIASVGYGCLDKVYITFPAPFWQPSRDALPNGTKESQRTAGQVEPASQSSKDDPPGVFYWLSPKYARSTNPKKWTQVCVALDTLPSASAHPTLLFYMYGECAQHIARLVSTAPPAELDEILFDFFRPYVSRLPNYSIDNPDCCPTGILATAWTNDRFAGHGSYSNFQTGLQQGDEDIKCMREGLPDRHIWFAGEHTAPFSALGTVTGAYLAGQEVAERIANKRNLGPDGSS